MNPLTNVKNITKLNELELQRGTVDKKSWHDMYKDSAWIFIGGLPYDLTEGDILTVFSQYGEIVNINLVRDKKTGKSKGFSFLCYANQKSTVLAVDNFNGIKLCNRTIRVDHVSNYKPPKENEHDDEITKTLKSEGCAPKLIKQENSDSDEILSKRKKKKIKKEKKKLKKKKNDSDSDKSSSFKKKIKIKEEKHDSGYDKYEFTDKRKKPSLEKSHLSNKQVQSSDSNDPSDYNSSASLPSKNQKSIHLEEIQSTSKDTVKQNPVNYKRHHKSYKKSGNDYCSNLGLKHRSKRESNNFDEFSHARVQSRDNNIKYSSAQNKASNCKSHYKDLPAKRKYDKYSYNSSSDESSKRHKEERNKRHDDKSKDESSKRSKEERDKKHGDKSDDESSKKNKEVGRKRYEDKRDRRFMHSSDEHTVKPSEKSNDYRYQKYREYKHHGSSSDERSHCK